MKNPNPHQASNQAGAFAFARAASGCLFAGVCMTALVAQVAPTQSSAGAGMAASGANVIKLDAYNVTAMRGERRFIETPASVVTMETADIVATGGDNAFEALRFTSGATFFGALPGGQFFSAMTAKHIIRGSEYGTLMLADGMPANTTGYYFTGDIPVQAIKRVEVVKGASSSLYGAEAASGIINIITGHPSANSVAVALGNYDYRNYSFALRQGWNLRGRGGEASVMGVYQSTGSIKQISDSGTPAGNEYEFGGSAKRTGRVMLSQGPWSIYWQRTYTTNKAIAHRKSNWVTDWSDAGRVTIYDNKLTNDYIRANGHGENWHVNFFSNLQDLDWKGISAATGALHSGDNIKGKVLGGDFQYHWKPSWAEFLLGATYMREILELTTRTTGDTLDANRDDVAVFLRAAKTFLDTWTATLTLRESHYNDDRKGRINAFTPQFQLLKVFPHQISAYASVGRSFSVPSLKSLYGSSGRVVANPDLDPDNGWTYEIGVKWEGRRTFASLGVFHMDFDRLLIWKTAIDPATNETCFVANNNPFRNTGIELSVTREICATIRIDAGALYNRPEQQKSATKKWFDVIGKWQANARVRWAWDRYSASFNIACLGDRKNPNSAGTLVYRTREMVPATLKAGVSLGRLGSLGASVDNLFNRRDVTIHPTSTPRYFATPRSCRVTYELTF